MSMSTSCLPLAEQLPLLPVADGRQLNLVEGGSLLEDWLGDCCPSVRDDIARLVPEVTSASTGRAEEEGPRQRLLAAVPPRWRAVHQRRPLLIIVEDVHWSDGTIRDFLTYASAQQSTGSMPVVTISRPGDISGEGTAVVCPAALVSAGRGRQIHVSPLTPDEVEEMAASVATDLLGVDQIAALGRAAIGRQLFG